MQNLGFDFVTNVTLYYDTEYCRQFPRTHTHACTHIAYTLEYLLWFSPLKHFIDIETSLIYGSRLSLYHMLKLSKYWNGQRSSIMQTHQNS